MTDEDLIVGKVAQRIAFHVHKYTHPRMPESEIPSLDLTWEHPQARMFIAAARDVVSLVRAGQ